MNVVQLGPLALDSLVLVCILAVVLMMVWTVYRDKKTAVRAEPVLWYLLVFSLLAGRIAFVWRFWPSYQDHPLHALNIRDGGFDWRIAVLVYVVLLGAYGWRHKQVFYRLAQSSLLGAVVIGLGASWLHITQPEKNSWFELAHLDTLLPYADTVQDGQPDSLQAYAGQPVVVNLWASWCPPCRREMPVLQAAQQAHPEVHFLFINQGESPTEIQHFIESQGLTLKNIWLDPLSQTGAVIDGKGLPLTLFIDAEGKIQSARLGELSAASLQSHLDSLRNN